MLGRELIIDVDDIEDYSVLETIDGIRPLMEKIIENCKLNVVGKCEYQFSPYGATMLYLLSESHLTIHT
jgi:S-adenosylmethionine/arginine decarboxylase-like enzyme